MTGAIGLYAFIISITLSGTLLALLVARIDRKIEDKKYVKNSIVLPGLIVNVVFVLLYFLKILPPVPISLKYIGIYHSIEKQDGQFALNYERAWGRFWEAGAQAYIKRGGDKIYCFVSIFSPAQFSEKINLVWFKKTLGGWSVHDTIPLPIVGGRDRGYRGYAYKGNFDPGDWQVRVVTSDSREVGRIYFDVQNSQDSKPREWRQDLY